MKSYFGVPVSVLTHWFCFEKYMRIAYSFLRLKMASPRLRYCGRLYSTEIARLPHVPKPQKYVK